MYSWVVRSKKISTSYISGDAMCCRHPRRQLRNCTAKRPMVAEGAECQERLLINRKTAKAIGLDESSVILSRVDEV